MKIPLLALFLVSVAVAEEQVIAEILPKPEESAWQKIAWRTDLWKARREAVEARKPIYLWEMDGHPLGCV